MGSASDSRIFLWCDRKSSRTLFIAPFPFEAVQCIVPFLLVLIALVSLTGYYLPNPPNPSGFFNLTQGEAVRALIEGPFIGLDDIFTGDGQKACHTLGGALAFASIGRMGRRGKCGEAPKPGAPLSDNALQSFVTYAKPKPIPGFESTSIIFGGLGPVSTIFQLPKPTGYLARRIPGLSPAQAGFLLERAEPSSVCFGGSRIRGNFCAESDLDVGFGSLSVNQANRIIKACNARVDTGNFTLRLDRTPIVSSFRPNSGAFSTIRSPEEFFGRCGIRSCTDGPKAGQPFSPSGSITYDPNFGIMILYP